MEHADPLAHLTFDITDSETLPGWSRLRTLMGAAVDACEREDLTAIEVAGEHGDPLIVARRDGPSVLLRGFMTDGLSGLIPTERLGPLHTLDGSEVWFDVFLSGRRTEVREVGANLPALLLTNAGPPYVDQGTAIDIDGGTVWIRGDLIDPAVPAGGFVGIRVVRGSLRLADSATVTDSGDLTIVDLTAPIAGELALEPAVDEANRTEQGSTHAAAEIRPPVSLTLTFDSGSLTSHGAEGSASAWGQEFTFHRSAYDWAYISGLWTLVLEYELEPRQFDADPIDDQVVRFAGTGRVRRAGFGLPVVLPSNPSVLGEAARAGQWYLSVRRLTAAWYENDRTPHDLASAWIGISPSGVTIMAEDVAPQSPAVTHRYRLWEITGSAERLFWEQSYDAAFTLLYRSDIADGDYLMVRGRAAVTLDRPVTTAGVPVPTPTALGTLLLHRFGDVTTASLGALVTDQRLKYQLALRNALVWTGMPKFVVVRGALTARTEIDSGEALLSFGVLAWAPTLPDPYVSNCFIDRRPWVEAPTGSLLARVSWLSPGAALVSFNGNLGASLAIAPRDASPGEPHPARAIEGDPDVGATQVEQGRLALDRAAREQWKQARDDADQGLRHRLEESKAFDAEISRALDHELIEVFGPPPNLLLLDVSTNQDLLGVGVGVDLEQSTRAGTVSGLDVHAQVTGMRVMALPQVQWEPVRTLDIDQDIPNQGWFPTPLASATDGGATQIGTRSAKLVPIIPADALRGTFDAYAEGSPVGIRTTFPFGLVSAIRLRPLGLASPQADLYELNRPEFPEERSVGGIQVTARAEGGRPDTGGVSPTFAGRMHQLRNGVDLATGVELGISVLGETKQPLGSVEAVFNNDMTTNPRVPVTRIDVSGYGGSNFSDWNDPFAAYAETAKVQFQLMNGRTALEIIKVNSVLHPWGVRVTRSVTIERRPGGGVIRRDSGWQAFTPGLFDYRYLDRNISDIVVAPYAFDAGLFRGLFNVRNIRPAPGAVFAHGSAKLIPYYFDADAALDGARGRVPAIGMLGYLQSEPTRTPANSAALRDLITAQGPIGGPVDTWLDLGGSGLSFRAQRIEVGLAMNGAAPVFVATVRGTPALPKTGAWSVVVRPAKNVPQNGGEAVPVAESRGVPVIRRYPIAYPTSNNSVINEPPLTGTPGDYRFADATDLFVPASPANDYALLQATPTHAFLFPRPFVPTGSRRIESGHRPALADILARSTSKGAFPPPANTIEIAPGTVHFTIPSTGKLALSAPVSITGHPIPLRLSGSAGHGSTVVYDGATMRLELHEDRWEADFTGLRVWSDISGLDKVTGVELRIVGSTDQRPQVAEMKSLLLQSIEDILRYIPLFGQRGTHGPIDLAATNAKHEVKVETGGRFRFPDPFSTAARPPGTGVELELWLGTKSGIDHASLAPKSSAELGAQLEGRVPLYSVGVATIFLIVGGRIKFTISSVSSSVTTEELELALYAGLGIEAKIGPFAAYAFNAAGIALQYDAITDQTKFGGLVVLEAGVNLVVTEVTVRGELMGLAYKDTVTGDVNCDFFGSVALEVDIFLVLSISATYEVSDTMKLS
ncbi:hypothetical protein H0264_23675 [Nocardia huaxiensis]|uniref:Uncharacterized protein n=1 Tax=Nocardia huaxiensis TaxID=2755382 RepID=A0A7D6ZTM5_9NOCA|nr:hypothetical protein [Nocardia huaxiensis]QLY28369.1 hypothetical protein H0264_23675 [Nocardia huaxiensis]